MIKAENLTKCYGETLAVDKLNFEIKMGEIVGLLGPNGAGKTTTMNLLTCYLPATSGTANILGFDIHENSLEIRKRIGYLPEDNPLYEEMAVYEYLDFIANLRGLHGVERDNRIKEIVTVCGIKEVISKDIGHLSRGYKQRVGFAQAILHNPEILILDEPTSGLDPNQAREIRELIKELKKEKTVILSTHILSEVKAIADRVMIINKGKVVADGTTAELEQMVLGKEKIYVKLEAAESDVVPSLLMVEHVEHVKLRDKEGENIFGYEIQAGKGVDIRKPLYKQIAKEGWPLLEMRREIASLEDIFQILTRENAVKEEAAGKTV